MSVRLSELVRPRLSASMVVGGVSLLVLMSIGTYMIVNPGQVSQPLRTAIVQYATLYPSLSVTGTVGNNQTVSISSSTGGQIVQWLVQGGAVVRAGQPLAYFSNYATNKQIVNVLQDRLLRLKQIALDAQQSTQLAEDHAQTHATLLNDIVAVHLAYAQFRAALQQAHDAKQQYSLSLHVPRTQSTAAEEQIVKDQTTVSLDKALVEQAQTKWRQDQLVVASSGTLATDQAALFVAHHQLQSAQALVTAAKQQINATQQTATQAHQQAILAAQQALDQATSQMKVDQQSVGEALAKLQADESPQAPATTLAQDQSNLNILQQQLTAAQTKLQNDESPQATASQLAQDQNAINVLETQVTAAQQKIQIDNSVQATQATLQQDQSSVAILQQQLSNAQNKLKTDEAPPATPETIQADQANLSVLQQQLQGAEAQLTVDTNNGANSSVLQTDQTNISVLEQEVTNAQNQLSLDESPPASATQIQSDQANIDVLQQQLSAAQNQLKLDQTQTASAQTVAQDQDNLATLQQQLTGAQNQLHVDQTQAAPVGTIEQDQANIAVLQQQIQAAQTQLQLDKTQTAPSYVIQEDIAALKVAQAQYQAAQIGEQDAQATLQQTEASVPSASVAAANANLAQALGTAKVDMALLNQAHVKLQVDQKSQQSSALLQEDQMAVKIALDQWQEAQQVAAASLQNAKASQHPSADQVLSAKVNWDQAKSTVKVDEVTWQQALMRYHTDETPTGLRGMLSLNQSVAQAKEALDQGRLDLLNAQVALHHSEITAPVAGQVVSITLAAGSRLAPQQPAVTLYPEHQKAQIMALVDAAQINQVAVGDTVTFQSTNFTGSYLGRVRFVSPVPTSSQGSGYQYPVWITAQTMPKGVTSGMLISVRIHLSPIHHVLTVPVQAIMTHNGQLGVYLQTQLHHFTFHTVSLEQSDQQRVQIEGIPLRAIVALTQPS